MNKLFTKIATSFVGIAMAIGVGVAVGSNKVARADAAAGDSFELVTDVSSLSANDTVVIGSATSGSIYLISTTQGSNNRTATGTFTVSNNKITSNANVQELTLGKSGDNWTLYTGSGYLYAASSSKNYLRTQTTNNDNGVWAISITNTGSATITAQGSNTRNILKYNANNGSPIFSCYNTSGTVAIYKRVVAKTWTVSFAVNTAGYGTVNKSSVTNVPDGASITTSGNQITINGTTVTATATASTAQYTYAFTGWSNNTGTVTAARTITANFSRTTNTFTVDGSNITHGSLDNSSNIEYNGDLDLNIVPESGYTYPSSVSVTMGGNDISNDVEYENGYLYYTPVTGNIVITATCPALGNTYSITTDVLNGTYSGDTSITDNGGVASVTIAPTGDYKLPASVSVSGADHTYNASTGVISLSNATGNVTISAAMVALTEYSITVNKTNASYTGVSTIKESRTASLTFEPDSGYGQPASVTVTGATYTWTRDTGVLSLSNPTGNVTVTYAAAGNELDSISISTNSGSYTLGDNFVMPTVTAKYTVNADADVTSSASYSGYDPYTTGNQNVTISYTEGGITKTQSYTANVSAKSVGHSYNKISSVSDIDEGDYILAYSTYAFDGRDANNGYTTVTITSDSISGTAAMDKLALHITPVTGGYTLQVSSTSDNNPGKYLGFTSGSNSISFNANAVTVASQTVSSSTHYTYASGGAFTFGDSNTVLSWNNNSSNLRYRFYKTSTTSDSTNGKNYYAFDLYKKVSSGTANLIRIVCDPAIDPATGYKGGDKFVGDKVYTTDFVVKKQYDTGTTLEAVTGFTINGGEEVKLTSTSNTITVSYTEGGIPKSTEVVVAAAERAAELESIQLVEKGLVKKSGYIDFASATWNLDNIYVHYYWSDDDFDTEVTLASLVATDDATISPIKPTVGATSFTVSYEYLEVQITNNTITLTEAVRSDYVTSMSWGNTTAAQFKHFSGEQLTEAIVNTWHVKATYAGAGEGSRLYWGDYDLYIGNKQITSLPYTWLSEDDGQALSIHYGEDVDGNEFVKTNDTAVGNICATINPIDHDEEHSGTLDKTATWTKEQSAEIYDGGSNLTELCDNGVDIDANIHMQGDSTAGSTAIRFWNDGIRCYNGNKLTFTPKNGAVIKKITFASTGISFDDGVTDSTSSPFTINDGFGGSAITLNFSLSSTVKMGADVVVEYQIEGKEITTVHYANQMEHFDAQKKVVEFAKFLNTTMNGSNVCSGTFEYLASAWKTVGDKYDALFGEGTTLSVTELAWAKNMLKYANAAWGSDAENACVEKAMRTYEFCIAKHDLTPFMYESDGTTPLRSINVSEGLRLFNIQNSSTILIVSIVSLLSVAAIGGYFFLRKRKED